MRTATIIPIGILPVIRDRDPPSAFRLARKTNLNFKVLEDVIPELPILIDYHAYLPFAIV